MLPGPSAALTALVASGLPADRWRFAGFLPRKRAELATAFAEPETLVAFESPRRVGASLAVLAELDALRPVAVCRELTKLHEEVVRGTAGELADRYAGEAPRGEVVLVVGPAPAVEPIAGGRRWRRPPAGGGGRRAAPGREVRVSELTGVRATPSTAGWSDAAIELSGVVKRFGRITAVDGIDLEVPEGICLGLLGLTRGQVDDHAPAHRAGDRGRGGDRESSASRCRRVQGGAMEMGSIPSSTTSTSTSPWRELGRACSPAVSSRRTARAGGERARWRWPG